MNRHFNNLSRIENLKGEQLTKEEKEFVERFGLNNSNLSSTVIYLPSGQVIKNSTDKNFIRTIIEERRYMLVNANQYSVEIQIKDNDNSAKIKAVNPIENRHQSPTITTEVTQGNTTVCKKHTFSNTFYDVYKADSNVKAEDFIISEKIVKKANSELQNENESDKEMN